MSINYDQVNKDAIRIMSDLRDLGFKSVLNGSTSLHEWKTDNVFSLEGKGYYTSNGATRFVIWDDNCECVFKIQFEFGRIDYCAQELKVYQLAREAGVEKIFAEIFKVCDFDFGNDIKASIYAMQRVDADEEVNSSESWEYHFENWFNEQNFATAYDEMCEDDKEEIRDRFNDYFGDCCGEPEYMVEFTLSFYSEKVKEKFLSFINKIKLNDLHSGNWGIDGGMPVLIDYAGYNIEIGG